MKRLFLLLLILLAAGLTWGVMDRLQEQDRPSGPPGNQPVIAVEAAGIRTGPISMFRTYSGEIEPTGTFIVAPKISGRIIFLAVDIGDEITRGQMVAGLDNAEYIQAVARAEADLAVAEANRGQAESNREIAARDFKRIETLRNRGISSESQLDEARARQMSAGSSLDIARAQVTRARAELETARIRLGYTRISADWTGGTDRRIVAETFVSEGDTVSANTPLISIVALDPVTGVIFVTEKDYAGLKPGLAVSLSTDAFPDRTFSGVISRIAPVFSEETRQARVEFTVANPDICLKPGMFIRASIEVDRMPDAVIIPEAAVTTRNDRIGVFLIRENDGTAEWKPVTIGIRQGNFVQVSGLSSSGTVVTLGQQLLAHGSRVSVSDGVQDSRLSPARKEN